MYNRLKSLINRQNAVSLSQKFWATKISFGYNNLFAESTTADMFQSVLQMLNHEGERRSRCFLLTLFHTTLTIWEYQYIAKPCTQDHDQQHGYRKRTSKPKKARIEHTSNI